MNKPLILSALLLAAVPTFVQAAGKSAAPADKKPHFEASQKVEAQATVLAVNSKGRTVTLQGENGDTTTVKVGSAVKNFAQIKKGDVVKVVYTEKLSVDVEPGGSAGTTSSTTSETAKAGEKPQATGQQKTVYKASITAIDKAAGTVTLQGSDGRSATITPRNPANLDKVKVGDLVVFTYTQAIAASVEKAAAK